MTFCISLGMIIGSFSTMGEEAPTRASKEVRIELGWDPILYQETSEDQFPRNIRSKTLITTGAPLTENKGYTFRKKPDYNIYFPLDEGQSYLFINHEIRDEDPSEEFPTPAMENKSGGITRLLLDRKLDVIQSSMHEWQMSYNCSGGYTGWDTFVSCEENPKPTGGPGPDAAGRWADDGGMYEIFPHKPNSRKEIVGAGRMSHEAAEPDVTWNFMMTDDFEPGFLYKFVPHAWDDMHGSSWLFVLDAVKSQWLKIEDPTRARSEALEKGGTPFQRLEGIARDMRTPQLMYFVITGSEKKYDHKWGNYPYGAILSVNTFDLSIKEVVVGGPQNDKSGIHGQLQHPDNIRFDGNGVLYICEDHENSEFSRDASGAPTNHGRNEILAFWDGKLYRFATMGAGKSEWTGPFFATTGLGKTLFVTSQDFGKVYALSGFHTP